MCGACVDGNLRGHWQVALPWSSGPWSCAYPPDTVALRVQLARTRCDTGASVRSVLVLLLAACGGGDLAIDAGSDSGSPPGMGSIDGTPVSSFETSSCSTSVVLALSVQIANEVNCMLPGQLVAFEENANIEFTGSAVLPYLSETARDQLYAAAAAGGGRTVRITSAFRTVVQQYLLRRWFELGRCGITAAAEPGRSNHESGRAIDVSNYSEWISLFAANGWDHSVPGDPVHFDHVASADLRSADVLAFQRLWNRNAPDEPIDEDGAYGPMTEAALRRAPAEGFGIGAICGTRLAPPSPITAEAPAARCAH